MSRESDLVGRAIFLSLAVAGLGFVAGGDAYAASLHLSGPREITARIESGVRRERPEVIWAARAVGADLVVVITRSFDGWVWTASRAGRVLETRQLGRAAEPAARLAVLLIVRRIQDLAVEEAAAPPPLRARTSTVTEVVATVTATVTATVAATSTPTPTAAGAASSAVLRATIRTSTLTVQVDRVSWEAGLTVSRWSEPGSLRPGLTVSGMYHLGALAFGARMLAYGVCCGRLNGDGISADAPMFAAAFAEGRLRFARGAFGVELLAAVGPTLDSISAGVEGDVFPGGDPRPEQRTAFGAGGLGALRADVALSGEMRLTVGGGVLWTAREFEVHLPAEFDDQRTPLARGRLLPFFELGVVLR